MRYYIITVVISVFCLAAPPSVNHSTNSAVANKTYAYSETVTYTCDEGFEIEAGSQTISCLSNDTWSPAPSCVPGEGCINLVMFSLKLNLSHVYV